MTESPHGQRRPTCARCQRPSRTLAESRAKVKTADIVRLCLSNSRIICSIKQAEAVIPSDAVVLFPSHSSVPLDQVSGPPRTLVLLDATWDKAKRLLARSPLLQSLQRVSVPEKCLGPPIFKARKSPTHSIKCARSTAEAAAAALECLEENHARLAVSAIRRVVSEASEAQLRFIRKKGPNAGRHRVHKSGYEPDMYSKEPSSEQHHLNVEEESTR